MTAGTRKRVQARTGSRIKRSMILGASVCVVALSAGACSSAGIYAIPLPGGADVGDNPMDLTVQFDDVLDLVPQSTVKVDGVAVGRVDSITVPNDGWTAEVDVVLNSDVDLPANAVASVQQTNLLGEKFIELSAPPGDEVSARLQNGATITLDRTRHATDIEQVLGALSLLLNGGGVGQLSPIIKELSTAFDGREGRTKELLQQANSLIDGLNQQRDDITRAIDGLDTLSGRVNAQTDKIDAVLKDLPIATEVLEKQRPQLTQMLGSLDRLGAVGTDVIDRSKDDLIADLRALRPTLQSLADSGDDVVTSLAVIPTLPFADGTEKIIEGNSANLFLSLDLSIGTTLRNLGVGEGDPTYIAPKYGKSLPVADPANPYSNGNGPRPGWPTISLLPLPPIVPGPAPGVPTTQASGDPAPFDPLAPLTDLLEQFGGGQ